MKRKPITQQAREREMQDIWQSFEWLFQDKVAQLDHLTWKIFSEMSLFGITSDMATEFMQKRFAETVEAVADRRSAWLAKERRKTDKRTTAV